LGRGHRIREGTRFRFVGADSLSFASFSKRRFFGADFGFLVLFYKKRKGGLGGKFESYFRIIVRIVANKVKIARIRMTKVILEVDFCSSKIFSWTFKTESWIFINSVCLSQLFLSLITSGD
jgi:hypothetical protein